MEFDKPSALPRKYYRLPELAKRWNLEVSELVNFAIDGVLQVAIEEFRQLSSCADEVAECHEWGGCEYPHWAVFLVPDVLKRISVQHEVCVSGGMRVGPWGLQPVFFPERRLTIDDLIVLPQSLSNLPSVSAMTDLPYNQPLSLASRKTLLKQIAALAVLLSKESTKFAWGVKPNSNRIAEAIEQAIAQWPAEKWGKLEADFFSKSKINDSIREGLELIGFKEEKPSP